MLAAHFLRQHAQRYRKRVTGFEAERHARAHRAPLAGQRARAGPRGGAGGADGPRAGACGPTTSASAPGASGRRRLDDMSLEDVECFLIKKALSRFDGNVEPGRRGPRPDPQRALPAAAALRPLSRRRKLSHERRVLLTGPPGRAPRRARPPWPCSGRATTAARPSGPSALVVIGAWLAFAFAVQENVVRPLQTISNLLAALREEDFSFRARGTRRRRRARRGHARGERARGDPARAAPRRPGGHRPAPQGHGGDRRGGLRLRRRAAARARQPRRRAPAGPARRAASRPERRRTWASAIRLGAAEPGAGATSPWCSTWRCPEGPGRFEVRRSTFRQGGLPHHLLVLANVSRALREEERQAWQRLIRVLGHELNNSLAPIKSIAGSLESLLAREPRPAGLDEDMRRGLAVIASRSEALSRFMEAYARLARLPPPQLQPVDMGALVRRVAGLETRLEVGLQRGPRDRRSTPIPTSSSSSSSTCCATPPTPRSRPGGGVLAGWTRPRRRAPYVEVWVEDEGPGLSNTDQPLRPLLHDQAPGLGHRPRAVPPDRRGPRRDAHPREPRRSPGLRGPAPPAALDRPATRKRAAAGQNQA